MIEYLSEIETEFENTYPINQGPGGDRVLKTFKNVVFTLPPFNDILVEKHQSTLRIYCQLIFGQKTL